MNYKDKVYVVTRQAYHSHNSSWVNDADVEIFATQELADEGIRREINGGEIESKYPVFSPDEFPTHITVYKSGITGYRSKLIMTTKPVYNKKPF